MANLANFGGEIGMEQQRRDDMRIQRRRERDEARRRKLLNAKTRLMGVDRNYLDQQVEALKIKKEIEKQSDMAYANQMKDIKHILEKRNVQEEQAKIEESLKTRNVWDVQRQQFTERSTFDLNDPNELKKRPKWSDDDVVGPASMRRFAGEDRHIGDRRKMQATQMKDWCAQMQAEKLQVKQRKDEEMLKHSQYLMDVDAVRNEMNKIELEQKMADNYKVAESNQQLAQMRQAERQQEVALQKQLNEMHNKTIENDPMIRESRDQAISTVPGRVRRDHWKGMTVSQLQSIQAENYENILVKKARQAVEAAEEIERAETTNSVVDILQQRYNAEQAQRVAEAMQYKLDQAVQIHEKVERDRELKTLYNTNTVTDGFFNRFGQSCR